MPNIKVVLWDIDSTLLDPIEPEKHAIRCCFEDFGFGRCTDEMVSAYRAVNVKWWDKIQAENKTKEEITVGRFEEYLSMFGLDSSKAAEFNNDYMRRLGDTVNPVPNAMETLSALKGRVKQYVVTNGMILSQEKKIINSGIDKLVDAYFISEAIGEDKPDKKFFDIVFERTGLQNRNEIMIVGDSLSNDMRGGNNAGIITCWFNPEHLDNNQNVHIDYEIDDIAQVPDIVNDVYQK